MAPISWLILFIFFFIIYMMFNMMNYFCFSNMMPKSTMLNNNFNKPLFWKW